jgi:hypothetical protein
MSDRGLGTAMDEVEAGMVQVMGGGEDSQSLRIDLEFPNVSL